MGQVIGNLLSNAAKFSHANDIIEVAISQPCANVIRISVIDHGYGIAREFYPTVFDKFTQQDSSDTRQKGGTGLGLSITKAIIEQHHGLIDAQNTELGAEFSVRLPVF